MQEHTDDTQTFTPLMIMMLLVGCAVGPDYQQPAPLATTHWNDKGDSAVKSQTSSAATNPRWWKTFGSPQLDSLIERAIAGNLTLQQTVLRIAGAREQINRAGGAFFPSVNGNVQATRQQLGLEGELKSHGVYDQLNNVDPELRGALGPLTQPINLYQGSFDAQWEIDLWGKVRRQVEAAEAQQRAAIEQRNDALVSLEAEVARAWLQLRGAQSIIATLNTQIESAQQTLDLTESRQRGGLSPQMDVENARAQLGNLEAQLPQYQAQERRAMNGLAILLVSRRARWMPNCNPYSRCLPCRILCRPVFRPPSHAVARTCAKRRRISMPPRRRLASRWQSCSRALPSPGSLACATANPIG